VNWIPFVLFAPCVAISWRYGTRALENLSPLGNATPFTNLIALGAFAGRKYFSEVGWRYRNLSFAWAFGGFVVAASLLWLL